MIQQKNEELVEIQNLLELRIIAYDILRRVFVAEPTRELIMQLQKGMINYFPFKEEDTQLQEGIQCVKRYLQAIKLEEDFDSLHWDYTRMFIGPYRLPAPIWESAYVNKDGLLFQEETLKVRRLYLENNLMSLQHHVEADDHLGLELDFMYQLSNVAADLLKEEKVSQLQKILTDQKAFLREHLLKWTPIFGEKVVEHAETEFYKGMVKILNGFLKVDQICLNEILSKNNQ